MWKLASLALLLIAASVISSVTLLASRADESHIAAGPAYVEDITPSGGNLEHQELIQMPPKITLKVIVDDDADTITVQGPPPWVNVSGTLIGPPSGGIINASGKGLVAGQQNIAVQLTGVLSTQGINGQYTMGVNTGTNPLLPGGQPITYTLAPQPPATPTPTRTRVPTATVTPKRYSIMVLKLSEDTQEPLSGWEFSLYSGPGCNGSPIAGRITYPDGLADFTGLSPGSYSVREQLAPGWNNVTPLCQDISTGGITGAGLPPCPIQPDQAFPQPGCDSFVSGARVIVRMNGSEQRTAVTLNGPTRIVRLNSPADHNGNGLDDIDTEIVGMELTGAGITVRESPSQASSGRVEEQNSANPGMMNFPADSFFDVFFEVDLPGAGTLHNEEPLRVECQISAIPPIKCFYQPPIRNPIVLYNSDDVKVATIEHALHLPLPQNEVLIVFTNRSKTPTPSRTPTATRTASGTATQTPAPTPTPVTPPPPATPTDTTATPTRTAMPTPRPHNGDANKDGRTNATDAALVLQFDAGRLPSVNPSADVNENGVSNSIDAALILQFVAGLLDSLPP